MKLMFDPVEIKSLRPLHDHILVSEINFDERVTDSGIILRKDDGKSHGIRPRWGKIYAVGPDQKELVPGQWICVSHGRWTRGVTIKDANGIHTVRRVDNNDILLVSDEKPSDETIADSI